MKIRILIITSVLVLISMQLVYAQPVPELIPELILDCNVGTIRINDSCVSTDGPWCGPGTTYQDGVCFVNEIENSTKLSSHKWTYSVSDVEPEAKEPHMSDEQHQMMQEYCKTGIHHPDMIGIPQCIKNELVCGPGFKLVDGICHLVIIDGVISEDHNGMGGFILIGILTIIAIIIIFMIWKKRIVV